MRSPRRSATASAAGLLLSLALAGCGRIETIPPSPPAREATPLPKLAATDKLTLQDVLRIADEWNPRVRAARHAVAVARGEAVQASLPPNPNVEWLEEAPIDPLETGRGRTTVSAGIPLALSGRLSAAKSTGARRVEVAEAELEHHRHETMLAVQLAWIEVLYRRDALAEQFELVTLGHEDAALTKRHGTALDGKRADLAVQRLSSTILTLATENAAALQRLRSLIGGLELTTGQVSGELERQLFAPELAVSNDEVIAKHPELRMWGSEIDAATAAESLSRRSWIPDPEIRLGGGYDRRSDESFAEVGIRFDVPVFDRNQGGIAAAQARTEELAELREEARARLLAELIAIRQLLNETDTLLAVYGNEYVPMATENHRLAREQFAASAGSVESLLDTQRELVSVRQQLLRYRFDFNSALARFRHLNGSETGMGMEHGR